MRSIAIFLFCLLFSGGYAQSLKEGLLVYYPFNWNTFDYSGNDFHGITNATLTEDRFGNSYSALHFNGIDQYLDFPPVKSKLKPSLPVSFAFWIKFEDISPFVTLILTTDYAQDKHTGAWVSTSWDGALSCGYGDGTGNGPYSRRSLDCNTILSSETWYYVIAIIQGAGDISVYLDCAMEEGTYGGTGGEMVYTDCQGSLGRKDSGVGFPPIYFKGTMDEFKYWNRALTIEEIDSLCNMVRTEEIPAGNDISIYPNPTNDFINIKNLPDEVAAIELLDSYGKVIQSFPAVEKIPVSLLSPGVYFLRFLSDQNLMVARKKFVKE
jgi:hypothetical protein